MIDCPNGEVRDLLPDLLHDRLVPAQRDAVRSHVDGCSACREELALLGELRASMHRVSPPSVAQIVAALPSPQSARAPRRFAISGWRAAAAAVLLAGGGTSLVLLQRSPEVAPVTVAATHQEAPSSPTGGWSAEPHAVAVPAVSQELAVAAGAVSDLTDRELASLLGDIESIDVLPAADAEAAPVELAPAARTGGE